jgi:ATP-dependent Clp protease ATP-binding subunit ClpC
MEPTKEAWMPKINVYLPEDLAAAVRAAGVPVSPVCQKALADAVRGVNAARKGIAAIRDPDFDPDRHPQFAARLTGRMTPRMREALDRAREAAGATAPVETRHLLIGLLDQGDNLGVRVLQALDLDTDEIREAAQAAQRADADEPLPTAEPSEGEGATMWTGLTLPARTAIGAALAASIDFGHNYLGCEHLLLGLLDDGSGGAARVLHGFGIETAQVRRAVTAALAGFVQARQPSTASLDDIVRRLDAMDRRLTEAGI